MNVPAFFRGGVVAGLFIVVSHYVLQWVAAGHQGGEGSIAFGVAYSLGIGMFTAYFYALGRPRWGPGVKSAATAGLVVWFLHDIMPALGLMNTGMAELDFLRLVWSGVEMAIAGMLAGWLYSEQ